MVFESLVVELINKFVGDYVENLDASQLKLGIWGGDAVLQNLDLKQSALDDLDLPVKIKAGHVGKLTLKIPWKNLYTEPVIAQLDGIYALAVPNAGIKYNEEKEEKAKQEAKQKKLKQIEERKKAEAEKDKPKEEKPDTFVEKMATQVIKNLQIKVNNIHVRYEDRFTNPKRPFAVGVTLQELLFQTTDESWQPCVIKDAVTQIFKLIRLDSLGVYWDSCAKMYADLPKEDIMSTLKSNIAAQNAHTDYQYLIKPISSVAHLKLNPKPEKNQFSLPKIFMTIVFDNIAVALSKLQYDDLLEMLEAFERTALMGLYRKYKPDVPLHKNAKAWWHYAYNAVLEETVRRRRRMFSWSHISRHRLAMKRYREAYVKKLDKGKASGDVQKTIDECEKLLDVFSITLMRQQAEVEAAKLGAKRKEEQGTGWFGGWFGGKKKKATEKSGNDIQEKFYEQFTLDEKNKLYGAIGYEENESDPTLPIDYIAVRLVTKLNNVSVSLRDPGKKDPQLLRLQLKDVFTSVGQRPAASAVSVEAKIDRLSVFGTPQNNATPKMVTSLVQDADQVYSLLSINLETNPLDGLADTRVKVSSRPLEIAYDAITVNQLGDFFKPPKSVQLKQLSQAAMAKFDEVKEQSATGLQHSIEQHKYTEISVDLMSSYVLVPEGGLMKKGVKMLLLDLGSLKVSSEKNQSQQIKGKMDSLDEVMARAYDKFNIQLARLQLLFIHPGEDWHKARWVGQSDMHILRPISININLQKCMFDKDHRMAKMKVAGELPLLGLSISDYRLQEIMALAESIPTGGAGAAAEEEPPDEVEDLFKGPSTMVSVAGDEGAILNKVSKIQVQQGDKPAEKALQRTTSQEFVNATDMELKFEIKEIVINVSQKEGPTEVPLLKLVIESVGTQVKMRTFDMVVEAYVGCLYLQHLKFQASDTMAQQLAKVRAVNDSSLINIINTPNDPSIGKLLMVQYVKANKEGPEFLTTYKNTEQAITVVFSGLELLLHQGAIISLLEFAQKLQPPSSTPSQKEKEKKEQEKKEQEKKEQEKKEQEKKEQEKTKEKKPPRKKKGKPEDPNTIDILVNAEMKSFAVAISSDEKLLTDIKIKGIDAKVAVQKAQTTVAAVLKDMTIYDPTPDTLYPKILGIEGSEVLKLDVVAYNNGTAGDKYGDMSCMDTKVDVALGCIRLAFLNRYVTDLLAFLDNFQAAKAKIAEAGEAMAEYSAEAVQSLQETASRIGLKIAMKAPLIIVPQKSTSNSVLMADLGNLEITNSFHLAGKNSPNNVPAVLDKMNIVLNSLKLSRAVLAKTGQVQAEVLLLEPVTISVFVNRNLSAAWYHDKPDIDLGGTLEALTVKLSQGDFTMTMSVLNDNLSEGQSQAASKTEVPAVEPAVQASQTSTTAAAPGSAPQTQGATETPTQLVYTKMKFNFQIKSISLTLYSGESKLTTGVCQREAIKALGKVALMMFALDGSMMSDTSMVTKVILRDTILDDLRPQSQKGISRMIQRSTTSQTVSHTANMIDVNFTQNATQDKNIDVKMSSLHVCVCVEFLMTLGDFFTKGMPAPPAGSATTTDIQKAPSTAAAAPTAPAAPAKPVPPTSEMTITLEIEKPDIILVEDQKNTNSNALMLNLGLMFKLRNTPDVQSMQANIKRLQIISCVFSKRDKPLTEVLQPCDISFISSAPYGKDHHMDINITDLVLNISPAIISTMAAISAGFATKPAEEEGPTREPVPAALWTVKKVEECNFWYLKSIEEGLAPEVTEPALTNGEVAEEVGMPRGEQLILNLPSLVIKLEGGVGHRTVPLLIVESSFQAEVRDWSSKLLVDSSLQLEVAYYNEKLAVWEPLVEPFLEDGKPRRWELGLEVVQNDDLPPLPPEDAEDAVVMPLPKMSVSIKSTDAMQLTMSKACLEVLTNLGKAFNDAYNLVEPSTAIGEVLTPYVIENYTGMDIVLKLDTSFETPTHAVSGRVKLQSLKKLPLSEKIVAQASTKASVIKATQEGVERKIIFLVEEFGATREVTIKRAEKRMFQINKVSHSGDKWAIVANTQAHVGQKIVALQSLIQVKNHLDQAVEVYYRGDTRTDSCGVTPPGGIFNIPLHAVYSSSSEFFFRPVEGYDMCKEAFRWRAAENGGIKQCACPSRQSGYSAFYFNVSTEVENIFFEAGEEPSAKSYVLHLYPTVILHNLLPFPITYMLEGMSEQQTLQKGENIPLIHASVNESNLEISIPDYQGKEWIGRRTLQKNVPELSVWNFESHDGTTKTAMDLGLHCKVNEGSFDVTLYSPYWMLNKTGQSLCYKGSDADVVLDHPADMEDVVLFSFKAKTLFGTKKKEKEKDGTLERKGKVKEMKQSGKAQLKIGDTEWSDKFSLDTVGSSGTVQCKSNKRVFEMGVKISLTSSGLTKIVTFTPFYMLLNTAEYSIMCTECTDTESWVEVVPGKCLPFWPEQSGKEMTMKAKVKDSNESTDKFLINKAHTSLMRLNNEYGGINTECQVTESAMVTTFKAYKSGMASVQIVNFTDKCSLTFFQSGVKNSVHELGPNQTQLYTWENALGKRELVYTCGNKKDVKNDLTQDGIGEFFFDSDTKIYWVSFLDGMQRVLLFTQDLALATVAQQAGELERIEQEVNVCIQGLGLSLVNNYNQTEVAFLGITSSGIIWEEKRKRYKAIKMKDGMVLEMAYQRFLGEMAVGKNPNGRMVLENKFDVDFSNKDKMMMFKPNKREIRRSFVDGIWLQYKTSAHQLQFHAKINRLQLDSQLKGAVFPTILAPIPPPKSVAAESVPKPFTEISLMQRKNEHSNIAQIKYAKVLIQEFAVKVDQGFLNALLELFASGEPVSREQETKEFEADLKKTDAKLMDVVGLSLAEEQKNFYDYLHLSPIKIHLSFSLQGGGGGGDDSGKPTQLHSNVLNIFMQSVGVVLTDVQDVVFKLGYFERTHTFYNQSQLVGEMTRHYAGQAIKQMYVLVLGLDVLGNPFGLLRGLSEGAVDLFYEPCQGAIQGPEEFAEGLALGVRSLFGHAVGGAAGAVSRITGTLGKGVAALTLDDDYQKKRREQLNKRPANAREGFARGGKGLVMGVFDGVTGIVRKPLEGAQEEGAKGFFKGIGKGLVGVVTRPTSGVIDFASSSFEGIRRIAEMSDEVRRLRPPRRFHSDKVIRPYNHQEAEGYAILQETEKGKYAAADEYMAHVVISKDGKLVFLVLDKRILLAKRGEIFGSWDCEWTYTWPDLKEGPKKTARGIDIILKEKEKKKFFGSSSSKKEVPIADPATVERIITKIEEAMARFK